MKEFGIYIHIPFCKKKCLYCDFPSYANQERLFLTYVSALEQEIVLRAKEGEDWRVKSIFFGGGTPTILPVELLRRLMEQLRRCFSIQPDAEITIEANPGTLDAAKLQALREMGFNRLSMGLQAWQQHLLTELGRIHTVADFLENFRAARAAGFTNINVDLMFALPSQTLADWKETLAEITALSPEHISAYSLIIEEGTPFYQAYSEGRLHPMDEALDRELYHYTISYLKNRGYAQYEISNFAREGCESRHNRLYWEMTPYMGLGLGAHSYFAGQRYHNTYDIEVYIAAQETNAYEKQEIEEVSKQDEMEEFMFLGLRMNQGVSLETFRRRFGRELKEVYQDVIDRLVQEGLLYETANAVALTAQGIDFSNRVFTEFLFERA